LQICIDVQAGFSLDKNGLIKALGDVLALSVFCEKKFHILLKKFHKKPHRA
jgi:hypothetical protein